MPALPATDMSVKAQMVMKSSLSGPELSQTVSAE